MFWAREMTDMAVAGETTPRSDEDEGPVYADEDDESTTQVIDNDSDSDFEPPSESSEAISRTSEMTCDVSDMASTKNTKKKPKKQNKIAREGDQKDTTQENQDSTSTTAKTLKKTKIQAQKEEILENRKHVSTPVPLFWPGRTFVSWAELSAALTDYQEENFVLFRVCSSFKMDVSNSYIRQKKRTKILTFEVPESAGFEYAKVVYYCTHGEFCGSRSTGKRKHLHYRFTGCKVRFTAKVFPDLNDGYEIRIRQSKEDSVHNHYVSEEIYRQYKANKIVDCDQLLGEVDLLVQHDISTRHLSEFLSVRTGMSMSCMVNIGRCCSQVTSLQDEMLCIKKFAILNKLGTRESRPRSMFTKS